MSHTHGTFRFHFKCSERPESQHTRSYLLILAHILNKTTLGRWRDLGRSVVNTLGAMLSQTRFLFEFHLKISTISNEISNETTFRLRVRT